MKEYIGSQEHWEDSVNADHDKRKEIQKDQEDNRTKDFYDEMKKERIFTETEISHLKSEVHKITGDGEVMQLFNTLLGVNTG